MRLTSGSNRAADLSLQLSSLFCGNSWLLLLGYYEYECRAGIFKEHGALFYSVQDT